MYLFYLTKIDGNTALLDSEEAAHCFKVLRRRVGDTIHFTDGIGNKYIGTITTLSKKSGSVAIAEKKEEPPLPYTLQIAIAPTKNINRLEWFIEKACEIGISKIQLLQCEHSERQRIRLDRLEKIKVAACKQSLRVHFPTIEDMVPFETFVHQEIAGTKLIAHCQESQTTLLPNCTLQNQLTILIGPEGDFSNAEIELALQQDYRGLSLGNQRLRTETAAIQACSWVSYYFLK